MNPDKLNFKYSEVNNESIVRYKGIGAKSVHPFESCDLRG